jgi:hypothetical protein
MPLTKGQSKHYREIVGAQAKFAVDGDSHKVAEIQVRLEALIARWMYAECQKALVLYNATMPISLAEAALDGKTQNEFRKKVKDTYSILDDEGTSCEWVRLQMDIEDWVGHIIDECVMAAVQPFVKLSKN